MKRRFILLVITSFAILAFFLMPTADAIYWQEKSCWESTESVGNYRISKVKIPGHIVFDDTNPYGHCDYAMWVYGKMYGHPYSTIRVHMYVEARYHAVKYYDRGGESHSYYWGAPPNGFIHFEGDTCLYGSSTPSSWTWRVTVSGGTEHFGMALSAAYTGSPDDDYLEDNSVSGGYRYLGYIHSNYATLFADQKFTMLIKCHVDNEIANNYYDGVHSHYYRYFKITNIESIRVKLVFKYYSGLWQYCRGTHTHILGDGVGPSDLPSIPLVPGSTT